MSAQEVIVFFSCPADMAASKASLADAIRELAPAFAARGILVRPWQYEVDERPAAIRPGQTVQDAVDQQLPRNGDGDLGYHIYVGLMCGRFGTPTAKAASGTVHEFLEAKTSFDRRGIPKVLFYFCSAAAQSAEGADVQLDAVRAFREQYPGLFATFKGPDDLLSQFRRNIVGELLDVLHPVAANHVQQTIRSRSWVKALDQALGGEALPGAYLDTSAETPRRVLRRLEELLGVEQKLSAFEKEVLTAATHLAAFPRSLTPDEIGKLLGSGPLATASVAVLRLQDGSRSSANPANCRCELVAALIALGHRLDLDHRAIRDRHHPPDGAGVPEWQAFLTREIATARGVVTYHLQVPSQRWIPAVKGVTALAFEALWQRSRKTLTASGFSLSLARSRIELNPDLEDLPDAVLERLQAAAVPLSELLPKVDHLGAGGWPELNELLPLPRSRVRADVTFPFDQRLDRRLLVDGHVKAELKAGERRDLAFEALPQSTGVYQRCTLEVDEGGGFEPRVEAWVARISAGEQAVLDRASLSERLEEVPAVTVALGLWNDFIARIWESVREASVAHEEGVVAYEVLHDAFESASGAEGWLFDRRDVYLNAMDRVREVLVAITARSDI